MPHYKDQNENIYFLDDVKDEYLLPIGCVQITDAQANTIRNKIRTIDDAVNKRTSEVTILQNSKLYTNIDATFPNGVKTIQFRNDIDWMNFLSAVTEAYVLPDGTQVTYRTADNVNQTLLATQLVAIGKTIDAAKKAILNKGWAHDDAIRALAVAPGTTSQRIAAILAYDITIGW